MFSDKIRELRKGKGWTQIDLAAKLGVSKATVGMWETGNREAGFDKLKAIAELFNVTTDELLGADARASIGDMATESESEEPSIAHPANEWKNLDDVPVPKMTEKEQNQLGQWAVEDEFMELIRKYWRLDEFGRRNVDTIIQNEYHRCVFQKRLQPTYGTGFKMVKEDTAPDK